MSCASNEFRGCPGGTGAAGAPSAPGAPDAGVAAAAHRSRRVYEEVRRQPKSIHLLVHQDLASFLIGIHAWTPFKSDPGPGVDVYFWAA